MQEGNDLRGRSRLPRGIADKNPVAIRLSPDERAELIKIAEEESRSNSNMARLIFLRGLEAFKADTGKQAEA